MASMRSSLTLAAILALLLAAGPLSNAAAQSSSPSSSSAISQPSAAASQSDALDSQIAAWSDAQNPVDGGAPGDGTTSLPGPRQIHGEAGAAVGSNGYRAGYVAAEIPIGSNSTLGVGVSESQAHLRGGQPYRNQSLDLSLMVGGQDTRRPCGTPAARSDQADPTWATRLRGGPEDPASSACGGPD